MNTVRASAHSVVASLDTLLSIFEVAVIEGAQCAALLPVLSELRDAGAGILGVKDLLQAWKVLVQRRAATAAFLPPEDVIPMADWFLRLQRYLDGTLPAEERAMLAQLPAELSWMPQMPLHLSDEIARRLSLSPPLRAPAQHRAQPEADVVVAFDTARPPFEDAFGSPEPIADARSEPIDDACAVFGTTSSHDGSAEMPHADDMRDPDEPSTLAPSLAADGGFFAPESDALSSDWVREADEPLAAPPSEAPDVMESFAAAPDLGAIGASETVGMEEGVAGAPSDQSPIWLGEEERRLILHAITQELMPLAEKWSAAETEGERAPALDVLLYQCELIGNVLEHIGMHAHARGIRALREQGLTQPAALDAEIVFACCAGLLAAIDQPGEDNSLLLAALATAVPGLDEEWLSDLAAEIVRVRIGIDPAQLSARKREAAEEDVTLEFAPDVLAPVLEGMLRELPGNTARLGAAVRAAVMEGELDALDEARRVAHTLKGDANTVGVRGLAGLTHALEDILIAYEKHGDAPDAAMADLLIDATDKIEEITDFLLGRGPAPDGLLDLYQRLLDASLELDEEGPRAAPPDEEATREVPAAAPEFESAPHVAPAAKAPAAAEAPPAAPAQAAPAAAQVRNLTLGSDVLDHLQDLAGEAMIVAQGIDRQLEGVAELRRVQDEAARHSHELLTRLDDLVALRGAALQSTAIASGTELDPLEIDQYNELHVISRQLAESHADVQVSLRNLRRALSDLADLRSEQEKVNRELQRSILRTRMVPFAQIAPRLQRIVRQTAKQVMKPVELEISGEETLLDAELLERIVEPMGHLIRNAIDHGVEPPDVRRRVRKPEVALLRIAVGVQGDAATIDVSDDGRGLDLDAIRARATDMGLLEPGAVADERRLSRFVLLPGFSTRTSATELSGRGVGMDVVNQRVTQLRGTLQLHSRPGQGLDVKIRVPITQTIANVVLISGQRYRTAVVASSVEQIVGFMANACRFDAANQALSVVIGAELVPAIPIESIYREGANVNEWLTSGGRGLLVRSSAGDPTLVLVRTVDEVRSVVVKPVSAGLPPIPAVRGITQLPDGTLAPVVDLDQLLSQGAEQSETERALRFVPPQAIPRIVVADDSLSARRSLEQLMRDAGYDVDVASDGFEAVAQVEARPTAVLLLDMEMPRMSGLEVARSLRNKAETRDLPILMITSRTASKHRQMAEEAGVTQTLSKPVSEDVLVTLVADLVAAGGEAHRRYKA